MGLRYADVFAEEEAQLKLTWPPNPNAPDGLDCELRELVLTRHDVDIVRGPVAQADAFVGLASEGDVWPQLVRADAAGLAVVAMEWAGARGVAQKGPLRVSHRLSITSDGRAQALPKPAALRSALRAAAESGRIDRGRSSFSVTEAASGIERELRRIWRGGGSTVQ